MRTYTVVSGIVFAGVVLAHAARVAFEGPHVLGDPFFLGSSLLALALSGWAAVLVLGARRRAPGEH